MVQPLSQFAAGNYLLDDLVPASVRSMDLDARLPLRLTQAALEIASERLRDDHLGLGMGRRFCFGMGGAYDYTVRSAATVRESLLVAERYSKLLADPFRISFEVWRSYAVVRLEDDVPWSRAIGDFAMSAWYRSHAADELPADAGVECWFPYSAPPDPVRYHEAFPGAALRFDAPFLGFVFNRACEDAPMPVADPALHAMLCARADSLLAGLKASGAFAPVVRRLIAQNVRDGVEPSLALLARGLHMSRRTICRKLEKEGSSFTEELDATRRELALAYARQPELEVSEIAFRLGFSHVESFYRAFKRWTGSTPLAYRRSNE